MVVVAMLPRKVDHEWLGLVVDFTALYRSIPIITTYYDTLSEVVSTATMQRPWISFEVQAY